MQPSSGVHRKVAAQDRLDDVGLGVEPLEDLGDTLVQPALGPDPGRALGQVPRQPREHVGEQAFRLLPDRANVVQDLERDLRVGLPAHLHGAVVGHVAPEHLRGRSEERPPPDRPGGQQRAVDVP